MYEIYEIKHKTIPGLNYIGQSSQLKKRLYVHSQRTSQYKDGLRDERLYYALSTYGFHSFKVSVLDIVKTKAQADEKEQYYIKENNASMNSNFNTMSSAKFYKTF